MRKRIGIVFCVAFLFLVGAGIASDEANVVRIGIVADVHVHDTNSPNEHKVMTGYATRLSAFVAAMNAWPADAVIELGDLVNGVFVMGAELGDPARVPALLDSAVGILSQCACPVHYVLGNHDVYNLSKAQFLSGTGSPSTYSSFDLGAFHFVILDAQYNKSGVDYGHVSWMVQGTIPSSQLDWLRADLEATQKPTIVCVHQPLDSSFELLAGGPPISNSIEVRQILATSGRVIAVLQGHAHESGYTVLNGIPYITFAALVDADEPTPPSWAALTLDPQARTIVIDGTGLQESLEFSYGSP